MIFYPGDIPGICQAADVVQMPVGEDDVADRPGVDAPASEGAVDFAFPARKSSVNQDVTCLVGH